MDEAINDAIKVEGLHQESLFLEKQTSYAHAVYPNLMTIFYSNQGFLSNLPLLMLDYESQSANTFDEFLAAAAHCCSDICLYVNNADVALCYDRCSGKMFRIKVDVTGIVTRKIMNDYRYFGTYASAAGAGVFPNDESGYGDSILAIAYSGTIDQAIVDKLNQLLDANDYELLQFDELNTELISASLTNDLCYRSEYIVIGDGDQSTVHNMFDSRTYTFDTDFIDAVSSGITNDTFDSFGEIEEEEEE